MLRARYAERQFAKARQGQRIDDEGGVERDALSQTELRILGEKLDAGRTWIEREDRVGFRCARLRQFRREVELVRPSCVVLAEDLTAEVGLEAGDHVLTGRIIWGDQVRRLDVLLVHVFADRLGHLVALPGRRKEPWRAEF